ncbi:MAG: DUF1573 domain-containing protein [Anaerolineae bacterium]
MSNRKDNQVVIRLDQRVFYAAVAIVGILALFGIGLYIGQLTAGGSRQTTTAAAASQPPLALNAPAPQAGSQPVQPVTSQQTGGQNPFSQNGPNTTGPIDPFGSDARVTIPEIKDKGYTWDFGNVPAQQKVEKVLQLSNNGKSQLIIDNVTASCGCTAAVVSQDKIDAGQSADLRVGYDPRVNKDAGKFISRKVQVKYHFSDDPAPKTQEFTITANVANQ